jgi:hypothetical protein
MFTIHIWGQRHGTSRWLFKCALNFRAESIEADSGYFGPSET